MGDATEQEIPDDTDDVFQSTRPVGDATEAEEEIWRVLKISIHASRGGRDDIGRIHASGSAISIHASRGGRDYVIASITHILSISIHASRGGRDWW